MPDSWQELDGDGVLMDWTSADTIRMCDLWHPIEALRRALIERLRAIYGTSKATFGGMDSQFAKLQPLYAELTDPSVTSLYNLNDFINRLVPVSTSWPNASYFIDHSDHSGNWAGIMNPTASTIPVYVRSAMLSSIGDSTWLAPTTLDIIYAWMIQKYKVINRLKWIRGNLFFVGSGYSEQDAATRQGAEVNSDADVAWGTAQSEYDAAGWTPYVFGGVASQHTKWNNVDYAPDYVASIYNHRGKGVVKELDVYGDSSRLYRSADLYAKPASATGYAFNSTDGYTENEYTKIATISETNAFPLVSAQYFLGDQQDKPPLGTNYMCALSDFNNNASYGVVKFDGPNGFKFKDW